MQENGCGTLNAITTKALNAIHDLGATHVWYTGVIRHATAMYNTPSIVKGLAGSPYAITDYYDVHPDLCEDKRRRMQEFLDLVERTHKAGMDVIIDFVPNHVAREYHSTAQPRGVEALGANDNPDWAFSPLNNFYYIPGQKFAPHFDIQEYKEYPARATGNDCFTASPSVNDWYETVKLNYGVFYQGGGEKQFTPIPDTWYKMLHILLFWTNKQVDGFRCDMAEMVPVEFWAWAIEQVKKEYPNILFVAEVYNPNLYRDYLAAGFDYLYDKVGMYDYLRGVTSKNWPAEGISQQWQKVDDIRDRMLYFLENHDEQRIASGFFCGRGMCAEPAMIVAATLGTNPVMVYAGQELGEKGMDADLPGIAVREYIDDMPRCMAAADLVISRCGAMTLSELPAAGKPAILIPSPYVAENHQYHNAMVLVERDAAVCIEEKDLTGERLWETICAITADATRLQKMSENMRQAAILDADARIYRVIAEKLKLQ